jgi:hypothetical protein
MSGGNDSDIKRAGSRVIYVKKKSLDMLPSKNMWEGIISYIINDGRVTSVESKGLK